MAIKSSKELEAELELAAVYEILPGSRWEALSSETVDTRRMLVGLRKKVLATPDRHADPSRSIIHAERTTAYS